jgi:hypothetical protein
MAWPTCGALNVAVEKPTGNAIRGRGRKLLAFMDIAVAWTAGTDTL